VEQLNGRGVLTVGQFVRLKFSELAGLSIYTGKTGLKRMEHIRSRIITWFNETVSNGQSADEDSGVFQASELATEESGGASSSEGQRPVDSGGSGVSLPVATPPTVQLDAGNIGASPSTSPVVTSGGTPPNSSTRTDAFQVLLDDNQFGRVLSNVEERCSTMSGAELFRVMRRISELQALVAAAGERALSH
jgi:hypothetical protein